MNSQYEYNNANKLVDVNFVHRNDENPCKTCLMFSQNKCKIMFDLIWSDMGTCFYRFEGGKRKISHF